MNILLTGVAGFIGSNLLNTLLKKGHFVVGLDNFNEFYNPRIKRFNVEGYLKNDNFVLVEGDITNEDFLSNLFSGWGIDSIVHLAAWAGVTTSFKKPILYGNTNLMGTLNLLEMARNYGIYDVVLASSSSVYGNCEKVPFKETFGVSRPISVYAATKKCDEVIAYTYSHQFGTNISCLRFFNAFGPRQRPDMAGISFIRKIYNGNTLPIYQDLDSTSRDYTYIDDICWGINVALENRFDYEIFNLGNSEPVTLGELVTTIEEVVGKKAKIKFMPVRRGEVTRTFADISKAKKLLGYVPKTSFREGIQKTYEWFLSTPQWYKDLP
ncbi:MAG: GDP-mannose 4,6-dehydratase [Patescibacteria group bacterium]